MNDINLSDLGFWVPIGTESSPFTGEFDGNGYTIRNLIIVSNIITDNIVDAGLFGVCKNSTTIIKNLHVSGVITVHVGSTSTTRVMVL